MSDDFDLLTELYFDGSASPQQVARLEELLQSDPAARAAFLLSMAQVVSLGDLERLPKLAHNRSEATRIRPSFSKRILISLALAACVALIAAAYLMLLPTGEIATLTASGAGVEVERNHRIIPVNQTFSLRARDVLHVGSNATAVLAYADSTRLKVASNTNLIIQADSSEPGKLLRLESGVLSALVAMQVYPFVIQTPAAQIEVVGTEFQVLAQESTRLNVSEGAVRIQRVADKAEKLVTTGQQAIVTAAASEELVAATVDKPSFQEEFEDDDLTSRGWYDAVTPFVSDQEHIKESRRSAEFRFPQGAYKPTSGAALRRRFPEAEAVLVSYWSKWGQNAHKISSYAEVRLMTNQDEDWHGPGISHLTVTIGGFEGKPTVWIQDALNLDEEKIGMDLVKTTESRAVAGGNGDSDGYGEGWWGQKNETPETVVYANWKGWSSKQAALRVANGDGWHHIVVYIRLNSVRDGKGIADGQIKFWCDGKLALDCNDVFLRTGVNADMKFNQFLITPYLQSVTAVDQLLWLDDLTVEAGILPDDWQPPSQAEE